MSELGFTEQEKNLIVVAAGEPMGIWGRLGHYAAFLTPSLMFGAYGMLSQNLVALGIGYLAMLVFIVWHIGQEFQYFGVFNAIFRKIAAFERKAESLVRANQPEPQPTKAELS